MEMIPTLKKERAAEHGARLYAGAALPRLDGTNARASARYGMMSTPSGGGRPCCQCRIPGFDGRGCAIGCCFDCLENNVKSVVNLLP